MNDEIDWIAVREEAKRQILASDKCFSCSRKAVAVVNTCSPTSASGMTPFRPRCTFCLLSILGGVNIREWRITTDEAKKELNDAIKHAKSLRKRGVNPAHMDRVVTRGKQILESLEKATGKRVTIDVHVSTITKNGHGREPYFRHH